MDLELTLERLEKGYHKEIVHVVWSYPKAVPAAHEVQNAAEAVLYDAVEEGCVKVLGLDDFQVHTDPVTSYQMIYDGELVDITDSVGGLADLLDSGPEPATSEAEVLMEVPRDRMHFYNDEEPSDTGERLELRYCTRVRYLDNFNGCPADTTGMKWRRPYCDQSLVPLLGLEVMAIDRDSHSGDDIIGRYVLHYDGLDHYSCIDFEWGQRLRGEQYPDVYLITNFDVHDSEFGAATEAHLCRENDEEDESCDVKFSYNWRNNYVSDLDEGAPAYRNLNFGTAEDGWNRRAMSMATVQKVLRSYQGRNMTGDLNVWWDGNQCTDTSGDAWPCAYDDNWFTLTANLYRTWVVGPHEAGHCYQMQLFEQSRLFGEGCPSPHTVTGISNDACATREGWVQFFATLT